MINCVALSELSKNGDLQAAAFVKATQSLYHSHAKRGLSDEDHLALDETAASVFKITWR